MKRVLLVVALLWLLPINAGATATNEPRTLRISIHHSQFSVEHLEFSAGDRVRFVVVNSDPIDHELIVGDEAVQQAHETGTEPAHGEVPGEVTVYAGESAETTYVFDRPGKLLFGCHYPGHYDYGMKGTISVRS